MIRTILIDDEELSLEELTFILSNDEELEILGAYNDSVKALTIIFEQEPDVVFVDISMPELNGFQIAQEILKKDLDTLVVFATAFNEHALKAFELEAIDYVLKPFSEKRIKKSLEIVKKRIKSKDNNYKNMERYLNQATQINMKRIPIWDNGSIKLIELSDIFYCEVVDKKTYVVTEQSTYEVGSSLNSLEQRVEGIPFFRCYKSFIVNLDYVDKIMPMFNQTYMLKLKGIPKEIPVSRHYAHKLRKLLKF